MFFEKYFYPAFVFITGSAIMFLEMAAFRLTTPYFGASLFVWANIIGLVMIALAIGYYFGGRIADLYPRKEILMLTVLACGVLVSFIPLVYRLSLPYLVNGSDQSFLFQSVTLSSFVFVTILFVLPLTILGMVSPFVIRLRNKEVATTGFAAGSIYAFSTMGSVFGTFFSSFLTIPFWGARETILSSAFLLILISLIGLGRGLKKPLLLLLFFPIFLNFIPSPQRENLLFEKESFYGLIEVVKNENSGLILDINRSGRWSVFNQEKIFTGMFFDYFLPLFFLLDKKENVDILIIGHAGGTISRQYDYFFDDKKLKITGVELDPEVSRAAFKFFDLEEQKNLEIVNDDGRIYLQNTQNKYDLIFIDAFNSAAYIPFQLATKEFFELVRARLNEGGIMAVMVHAQNPAKERVFRGISQTIKSVFNNVYFFPGQSKREYFIAGSSLPLQDKFSNLEKKTDIAELKEISEDIGQHFQRVENFEEKYILTDNLAPTEMLRELDKISIYFNKLLTFFGK